MSGGRGRGPWAAARAALLVVALAGCDGGGAGSECVEAEGCDCSEDSCVCGGQETSCGHETDSGRFTCVEGADCRVSCLEDCTLECRDARCTFDTASGARQRCRDSTCDVAGGVATTLECMSSTCRASVGAGSLVECSGKSSCEVECDGSCEILCTDGAVCDATCSSGAPEEREGVLVCP